jgi:hypothetical protein
LSVNVIENTFDEIGRGSINGIGYVNVIGLDGDRGLDPRLIFFR